MLLIYGGHILGSYLGEFAFTLLAGQYIMFIILFLYTYSYDGAARL